MYDFHLAPFLRNTLLLFEELGATMRLLYIYVCLYGFIQRGHSGQTLGLA